MSSQANWIGVAGELIKEWTRRHLAWTAHYDVYPWCIDQVLIVVVVWVGGGRASNKQSKQTNSLSDASATGDSQQTVEKSAEKKNSSSSLPHFASTFARFGNSLYGKSFAQEEQQHMALVWSCHKHTHTRVSSAQSSVEQAPQAGMPFPSAGGLLQLQAHSLQKLLIRRSSHVIQILTYSDFASLPLPPPVSCPSLRASLHRLRPVLVVEISDPIHIRKLKANVKTHKVWGWGRGEHAVSRVAQSA